MTEEIKPYNLAYLKELDIDEPGALKKIIEIFLETTPPIVHALNRCHKEKDLVFLAEIAHKLKSSIDVFSISPLQSVIRRIEQLAKQGDDNEELAVLMEKNNTILLLVFSLLKEEINE